MGQEDQVRYFKECSSPNFESPLGNLTQGVNFPICMAPMVGLSHIGLRAVAREYLPEGAVTIWPSEMLNSRRVPHENLEETPAAMKLEDESVWIPQILGNEEVAIRKSVEKLLSYGAKGIDINMGCPVKKALRHNYGVALLGDPDYAAQVVKMAKIDTQIPVSVKLRVGEQKDWGSMVKFVKGLEASGADWLTFHPRTSAQKRRGRADWGQIQKLKEILSIPLIGNGDVQTVEDALSMIEQCEVDMVMVGRAMTVRPWILWQFGEHLGWPNPPGKSGKAPRTPIEEGKEYGVFLKKVLKVMEENFSESYAIRKFQFLVRTGAPWLKFGQFLFSKVTLAKSIEQTEKALEDFFSSPQEMIQKTELRQ